MPIREEITVNHVVLRWAREETGLTPEQAAARARIRDHKRRCLAGADRLLLWESGTEGPTLGELETIAKAYRRPILTFFMPEPPRHETNLNDFRTLGDRPVRRSTPEFSAFVRQIEGLQREVSALVEAETGHPIPFVASASRGMNPSLLADEMRSTIQFAFEAQVRARTSQELFRVIRQKLADAGVFVLRQADLGSHHSKISVEEFRGLAISDRYAPFIVVNPDDATSALLFTLIHELTHLWLGQSGISNLSAVEVPQDHQSLEVYCNRVAAEFLVPERPFMEAYESGIYRDIRSAIEALSATFKVSRLVIARRLLEFDRLSEEGYWTFYQEWRAQWEHEERPSYQGDDGPRYIAKTKSRLGRKLLTTVIGAAYEGRLSYIDASRMLGIKINHFGKLYEG